MEKVKSFQRNHLVLSSLLLVGFTGTVIAGGYFGYQYWTHYQTDEAKFQRESEAYKNTWDEMIASASKQTKLPKDEVPVLATITDVTALEKNSFYARAKEGDKVVMYKKNRIVLLYRPSEKKVIARSKLQYVEPTPEASGGQVAAASTSAQQQSGIPAAASQSAQGLTLDKLLPQ